ncbi:ATP-binding protein [Paraflavisolibacter sp. H34]|uniref:sensor histidine kinase n=1 Tax=Huijunlia imazamoxiresistens TaxID=3127457 RepID=UPI003017A8EC
MNPHSLGTQPLPPGLSFESAGPYLQLLQSLPAALYTCDAQGYIQFYNEAAVQLWGREPEIGKDLWCGSWRIYRTDGSPVDLDTCPMAIALKEQRPVLGEEIVVERPDGLRRNVLPHPQPIFDRNGKLQGASNLLVDITDYKRLKEAHHRLEVLNADLEQFAYAASHDLQEPLRKIQTYASRLCATSMDQLSEKGKGDLMKVCESAERMMNLIKGLLHYSHKTNTEDDFVTVDLEEVLSHVQEDLELVIQQKGARIQHDPLPPIQGIPLQINQLFYNLVNNSLKFSRPGIPPEIRITCLRKTQEEEGSDFLEIRIADNGIGFDAQHSGRIFKLFQRLNSPDAYSGTGIGLALCKKIVANHRGEITATAEAGQGAVFCIRLPVKQ